MQESLGLQLAERGVLSEAEGLWLDGVDEQTTER